MSAATSREAAHVSERVLVLVKGRRETDLTIDLLAKEGFSAIACRDIDDLCASIEREAGAVLIAEEVISPTALGMLRQILDRQPAWSDLPVVVFSAPAGMVRNRAGDSAVLGNVTFLDRPVRVRTMLASVHGAIASRRRQYEARRAIESRDAFLAMLGHELRNQLGVISLAAGVLQRKAGDAPQREHTVLVRQTAHLARVIDDLLDVARFTHGKIRVERQKLDLTEVVRESFDVLQPRAASQGVACVFEEPAEKRPLWVNGDRQRLGQALSNLLTNAIKYTPRGGFVRVAADRHGGMCVVEVKDTGVGLDEAMRSRVFEPFTQVDSSLDRAQGGLGLGLAIVRSVVELHDGSIEATSGGLGKGTAFVMRLPAFEAPSEVDTSAPPSLDAARSKRRVLFVEDSEDLRELLAQTMRGHDVVCAEDGREGLERILSWRPDIAFVDLGLPGIDGFEVARRCRSSGFHGRLVALSGYGQADDIARARAAGFDDHLVKPVVDDDLHRAVDQLDAVSGPRSAPAG